MPAPRRSRAAKRATKRVRAALERLAPEHREIIVLAHTEKLTLREIAQRRGIPVETARRRATEALHGLRDELV